MTKRKLEVDRCIRRLTEECYDDITPIPKLAKIVKRKVILDENYTHDDSIRDLFDRYDESTFSKRVSFDLVMLRLDRFDAFLEKSNVEAVRAFDKQVYTLFRTDVNSVKSLNHTEREDLYLRFNSHRRKKCSVAFPSLFSLGINCVFIFALRSFVQTFLGAVFTVCVCCLISAVVTKLLHRNLEFKCKYNFALFLILVLIPYLMLNSSCLFVTLTLGFCYIWLVSFLNIKLSDFFSYFRRALSDIPKVLEGIRNIGRDAEATINFGLLLLLVFFLCLSFNTVFFKALACAFYFLAACIAVIAQVLTLKKRGI